MMSYLLAFLAVFQFALVEAKAAAKPAAKPADNTLWIILGVLGGLVVLVLVACFAFPGLFGKGEDNDNDGFHEA